MPSWSRSPETRAIHLDRDRRVWVRWLFRCGLRLEHIAIMLELEPTAVAECIDRKTNMGPRPAIPTGPPRRSSKPAAIMGQNGAHVRTLQSLGYDAPTIARVLDVELAAVVDFLARIVPIRRAELVKTRTRKQQRAIRPPRPRSWRLTDARDVDGPNPGDPPPLPAADALLEVDDLVELEVPPPPAIDPWEGSPSVEVPPAGDPWTGPATLKATGEEHGNAKLTWRLAREIRRQHAAGWSCYRLAKQLGVHASTVRCIVKNLTWVEDHSPALPAPDALSDADCGTTVQNTGENGPS
jgi:hypothetical protein